MLLFQFLAEIIPLTISCFCKRLVYPAKAIFIQDDNCVSHFCFKKNAPDELPGAFINYVLNFIAG